jgi:hypothetical protein
MPATEQGQKAGRESIENAVAKVISPRDDAPYEGNSVDEELSK